ncbi:MAG: glycosyltransferase [bacterium]|nr:glycosyltransferase [bacterium]
MNVLSIIIPTRNEAKNVKELVERIKWTLEKDDINYEIVFIDYMSDDDTFKIVKELKEHYPVSIYAQKTKGKALAIIEGATYCHGDLILMIDGDLQYPPEAISKMYKLSAEFPVVVARRKINHDKWIRKIASKIHLFLVGVLLFNLKCDLQSGLKLFPKSLIGRINMDYVSDWTLDLPLLISAKQLGYPIGEVLISFEERVAGTSKVSILNSFYEHLISALRIKFFYKSVDPDR